MLVRKCDRCGEIYKEGERTEMEGHQMKDVALSYVCLGSGTRYNKKHYDLCPDCVRSLGAWLEGEGK